MVAIVSRCFPYCKAFEILLVGLTFKNHQNHHFSLNFTWLKPLLRDEIFSSCRSLSSSLLQVVLVYLKFSFLWNSKSKIDWLNHLVLTLECALTISIFSVLLLVWCLTYNSMLSKLIICNFIWPKILWILLRHLITYKNFWLWSFG